MSIYFGAGTDIDVNKYPSLTYADAQATADTTNTSTTDVLLNSMIITPVAGVYIVNFSTSFRNTNNGAVTRFSVYSGGVQVASSERLGTSFQTGIVVGNQPLEIPVATQALVSVNGSQAIEIRWRVSAGTATAHQRNMTILKVASV